MGEREIKKIVVDFFFLREGRGCNSDSQRRSDKSLIIGGRKEKVDGMEKDLQWSNSVQPAPELQRGCSVHAVRLHRELTKGNGPCPSSPDNLSSRQDI